MLYDSYRKKIRKFAAILKWIVLHRVLLISVGAGLIALLTAFLSVKGSVIDPISETKLADITYGESLDYSASAIFGDVYLEYSNDGVNWSTDAPSAPGLVYVRAVSDRSFGAKGYGNVHTYNIAKKPLEIIISSNYVTYGDAPAITAETEYEDRAYCDEFIYDDITAEDTDVLPDLSALKIFSSDGRDVTAFYELSAEKKFLHINKKQITLTASSAEKTYDGAPLTAEGYTLSTELAFSDRLSVTSEGSIVDAGAGSFSVSVEKVETADGKDVTAQYDFNCIDGDLIVFKRPITVTTASGEHVYDGETRYLAEFTLSDDTPLAAGEKITLSGDTDAYSSFTFAGEYYNSLDYVVKKGESVVTDNYDITEIKGTFNVLKRSVTLTTAGDTFVYDGNKKSAAEVSYADSTEYKLVSGQTFVITEKTEEKSVGVYENMLEVEVSDGESFVTENYDLKFASLGSIVIEKAAITVLSGDNAALHFTYDGESHYIKDITVSGADLGDRGERAEPIFWTEVTDRTDGTENEIEIEIYSSDGDIVTSNYEIEYVFGKIYVDRREIILSTPSDEKIYDGTPLTNEDITVQCVKGGDGLVGGQTWSAEFSGSITDVGDTENKFLSETFKISDDAGIDMTDNYSVKDITFGTLTVKKRPITVETYSGSFVYDDTEKTFEEYTVEDGSFVLDHRLEAIEKTTFKDVIIDPETREEKGRENEVTYRVINASGSGVSDHGNDLTANYDITVIKGSVTVKARPVTITSLGGTKIYDGVGFTSEEARAFGYEIAKGGADEGLVSTHREELLFAGVAEYFVAKYDNAFEVDIYNKDNNAVTCNYKVTRVFGTLEILKRAITFKSADAEKVYDGDPLERKEAAIISGELPFGEEAVYTFNSAITDAGEVQNLFGVNLTRGVSDTTENYDITVVYGTLTVKKRTLRVHLENTDDIVYDGLYHTPETLVAESAEGQGLVKDHYIKSFETDGGRITVGVTYCRVKVDTVIIEGGGEDRTANYIIDDGNSLGRVTVVARPIAIKAESGYFTYDGTAHRNDRAAVDETSPNGLVAGQTLTVVCSGERVFVGESDNDILSYEILSSGEVVTDNYSVDIIDNDAKICVSSRPVTVKTGSAEKVFDGTPVSSDKVEIVSELGLVFGDRFVLDGSATELTEVYIFGGAVSGIENKNAFAVYKGETDISENYDLSYVYGTLSVLPRNITFITPDKAKIYNGLPLSAKSVTVEIEKTATERIEYAENENSIVYYSGENVVRTDSLYFYGFSSITSAGETQNTFAYDIYGADNYNIYLDYGTLTVEKRTLYLTTESASKPYDGEPLSSGGYSFDIERGDGERVEISSDYKTVNYAEGDVNSVHNVSVYMTSSILNVGSVENSAVVTITIGGADVTDNYEIDVSGAGTLTVEKRLIEIETKSKTFVFNGVENGFHGAGSYEIVGGSLACPNGESDILHVDAEGCATVRNVSQGKVDNYIEFYVTSADGLVVTDNYLLVCVLGKLDIEKRAVTVKAVSASAVFDGTPLTSVAAVAIAEEDQNRGLIDGHYISAQFIGEQVNANEDMPTESYVLAGSVKITSDLGDETDNYDITVSDEPAYLTVYRRPISIELIDAFKIYDGEPLYCEQCYLTLDVEHYPELPLESDFALVGGGDIYLEADGVQTEVGSSTSAVVLDSVIIYDAFGNDVSYNYIVTKCIGATLTVAPREITVTAASAEKVYDGESLSENEYTLAVQDEAEGVYIESERVDGRAYTDKITYYRDNTRSLILRTHYLVVTVVGERTDAGTVENVVTLKAYEDEELTVLLNCYEITTVNGTLTVTPAPLTVVTKGNSGDRFVYNGEYQYLNEFDVSGGLIEGHTLYIPDSAWSGVKNYTDKGEDNVFDISGVYISDGDGNAVNVGNYDINVVCGKLYVDKRPVTVTTGGGEWVYDGTSRKNEEFEIVGLVLSENAEHVAVKATDAPSITYKGSVVNKFSVRITDKDTSENCTNNYLFEYVYGTLTIIPRTVFIKPVDKIGVEYCGGEIFADGVEVVEDEDKGYLSAVAGDKINAVIAGSAIAVGEETITTIISVESVLRKGKDVTECYDFVEPFGTGIITVVRRALTIIADSKEKVYDGEELTSHLYEAENLVDGESVGLSFAAESAIVNVGETANVIDGDSVVIYSAHGDIVTDCYDITIIDGFLRITARPITIAALSAEKVYDGTPLESAGYDESAMGDYGLVEGHYVYAETVGERTSAGSSKAVVSYYAVSDGDGADVTDNYAVTTREGTITVLTRPITLVAEGGDLGVYDGAAHTNKEWHVHHESEYDLVEGHTLTPYNWAEIRYYGSVENGFDYKIEDEDNADVTENYSVSIIGEDISISRRYIKIKTGDGEFEYDGEEHYSYSYEILGGSLAAGDGVTLSDFTVTFVTDAAGAYNAATVSITDRFGVSVSENGSYDIDIIYGRIIVYPREITVKAVSEIFVYDGEDHYLTKGEADRLLDGDVIELLSDNYRRVVGVVNTRPQEGSIKVVNAASGADVSENYNITVSEEYSVVEVLSRRIAVRPKSASWIYDGEIHFLHEAETYELDTLKDLVEGHKIVAKYNGEIINVGTVYNIFDGDVKIFDEFDNDVTDNYSFVSIGHGTLEVSPREIDLYTDSYSGVYDGLYHTAEGYEIYGELADGEVFKLNDDFVYAKVKNRTEEPVVNAVGYRIYRGEDDVTANYIVHEYFGTLEVSARELTIKTEGDTWIYDGLDHRSEGFIVTGDGFAAGEGIYVSEAFEYRSVRYVSDGAITNVVDFDIVDGDGYSTIDNYYIVRDFGTIEILPKPITFITGGAKYVYNGKDRVYESLSESYKADLVDGDEFRIVRWTSRKDVGVVANEFTFTITNAQGVVTDCYEPIFDSGDIEIIARGIRISVDGGIFVYDDEDHTVSTFEIEEGEDLLGLAEGQYFDLSACRSTVVHDVTSGVKNEMTIVIKDENGTAVTENYSIVFDGGENGGMLVVSAREITVRPKDKQKVYDGTMLVCEDGEIADGSLAKNTHYIRLVTVGSQTDVGTSSSSIGSAADVYVYNERGDVTSNYAISVAEDEETHEKLTGKLTVTARPLSIKPVDALYTFDGSAHGAAAVEDVSEGIDSGLLRGHYIKDFKSFGQATYVSDGKVRTSVGTDEDGKWLVSVFAGETDVTGNYDITCLDGTVSIDRAKVSVKTASAEKTYDGTPLTDSGIAGVTADNAEVVFQGGEYLLRFENGITYRLEITVTGGLTDVGIEENTYAAKVYDGETDISENFCFANDDLGLLTVVKRAVYVTFYGADFGEYDGVTHYNEMATIAEKDDQSGLLEGHRAEFSDWVGVSTQNETIARVRRVKNGATLTVLDGDRDVTENYEPIVYYDGEFGGTLTLHKRRIEIQTSTDENKRVMVYNGSAQSDRSFAITKGEMVGGQTLVINKLVYGTDVGEYTNELAFIVRSGNKNVTDNYDIKVVSGTFEITRRKVVLKALDETHYFDGDEKTITSATAVGEPYYTLVGGHKVAVATSGSIVKVGSIDVLIDETVAPRFTDAADRDVTNNYEVVGYSEDTARLTVLARPITVTAANAEKYYDGTPLTCNGYSIGSELSAALVKEHFAVVTVEGSIIDAGYRANTVVSVVIYSSEEYPDGEHDVTDQYDIETLEGVLTVWRRPITVKTYSAEKTYDGTPLKKEGFEIKNTLNASESALVSGHFAETAGEYASATDVSDSGANTVRIAIKDGENNDVTQNYDIIYSFGTLTVKRRTLRYATESGGPFVYDGEYHSVEHELTGDGLVFDEINGIYHNFADVSFIKARNAGVYDNIVTFEIKDGDGNFVTDNYAFVATLGSFTVTKRNVTVETESAGFVYDGTKHYFGEFIVTGLASSDEYFSDHVKGFENANGALGEDNNSTIAIIRSDSGESVTENYSIDYVFGKVYVSKRPITFKIADVETDYDGAMHGADNGLTAVLETSFAEGHYATVSTYETYKYVCDNKVLTADRDTLAIFDEFGYAVTENYAVGYFAENKLIGDGAITILKRAVTIKPADVYKEYDGRAHYATKAEVSDGYGLIEGDFIYATFSGSQTNVGRSYSSIESVEILNDKDVLTQNYDITLDVGVIEVYKRSITLYTADGEKVYDGTELKAETGYVSDGEGRIYRDNLFGRDYFTLTAFASVTDKGSAENTAVIEIFGDDGDASGNYEIFYRFGTLTVFARPITVSACDRFEVYDGTWKTATEVIVTGIADGDFADESSIVFDGGRALAGSSDSTPSTESIRIYRGAENLGDTAYDKTGNYDLTVESGKVVISKRPISITAENATKEFDNTSELDFKYAVDLTQLADGDELSFVGYKPFAAGVGEKALEIDASSVIIKRDGSVVTDSYLISPVSGRLEIYARKIIIYAASAEKYYDGEPLTAPYTIVYHAVDNGDGTYKLLDNGLIDGDLLLNATVKGIRTEIGTSENIIISDPSELVILRNEQVVTGDYRIIPADGENVFGAGKLEVLIGEPLYLVIKPEDFIGLYNAETMNYVSSEDLYLTGEGVSILDEKGYAYTYSLSSVELFGAGERTVEIEWIEITAPYGNGEFVERIYNESGFGALRCYTVEFGTGVLRIERAPLTVFVTEIEETYSGAEYRYTDEDFDCDELPEGIVSLTVSSNVSIVNAGVITFEELADLTDYSLKNADGEDLTENYIIVFETRSGAVNPVTVNKRAITVTADSKEKSYDGKPLLCDGFKISGEGLAAGDTVAKEEVMYSGMQINIGTSSVTVDASTFIIINADGEIVTENYDIEFAEGTLTVK